MKKTIENFYVIGLGLIGGSLALDIKSKRPNAVIYGIDSNENHIEKALELGVIDIKGSLDEVSNANWVIIAVPVDKTVEILVKVLDIVPNEAIVFDVGSTKSQICEAVKNHPKRRSFIAAHPIAGTEFSGPEAAVNDLFLERTNIICEVEKTAFGFQEKALQLFKEIGTVD